MSKGIIIFLIILSALSFSCIATTDYPTLGYQKYNSYYRGAFIDFNADTAINIPGTQTLNGAVPLVGDLDADGTNEIVLVTSTDYLLVQHFTGRSFQTVASTYLGPNTQIGITKRFTPAIVAANGDSTRQIAAMNTTHYLLYNFTMADGLTLQESVANPNSTGNTVTHGPDYFIFKCSSSGNYGGIVACYVVQPQRTPTVVDLTMHMWDLTNNTVFNVTMSAGNYLNFNFAQYRNIHIMDIDNDGLQEAIYGAYDASNGDNYAYIIDDGATGLTSTLAYKFDRASNYYLTDIAVGDFDGVPFNGLEIADFGRFSATTYDATVVDRRGTVIKSSFGITQSSAGGIGQPLTNLVTISKTGQTLFCSNTYYSTLNRTIVYCFDANSMTADGITENSAGYYLYTSSGATWTMVDRFSNGLGIVNGGYLSLFSSLVLQFFDWHTVIGGASLVPFYSSGNYTNAEVLDLRMVGVDDVLYSNLTAYSVLNTLGSNHAPVLYSYEQGTASPSCQYVMQKFMVTLTDVENDSITCSFNYSYVNGTTVDNQSQTKYYGETFQFLESLDALGSFYAVVVCGDNYHVSAVSHTFTQVVSNASTCYPQDVNPVGPVIVTPGTNETADQEFTNSIDDTLDNLGLGSHKARAVLWLIVMVMTGFAFTAIVVKSGAGGGMLLLGLGFVELIMMLIGWYLGMIGTVVIVMVGLLIALVLTVKLMSPGGGGAD